MSSSGPPPVPPGPLLSSGRRRRRNGRIAAGLVAAAAVAAVAAAAYFGLAGGDGPRGAQSLPIAAGVPPPPERAEPPEPAPVVPAEPVPDVPLTGTDSLALRLRKPPRAALVFDVRSGEALWTRRPLRVLPMASLTKIMTALLVVERTRPREPVRITGTALRYQGSGVGMLPRGRRVRLETLLNGMLLVSGNDAAIALADHVSGSERAFVRAMNQRARELGLDCTRFASSHGLEAGNRSCARDLAVLTRLAMERRRIRRVVRRRQAAFRFPIKGGRIYLTGHNPLIRARYPGAIGLKTGYTYEAGLCFVGVARRGGRTLAVVLLHSANPLRHAAKLLDAGFARSRAG